MQFTKVRQYFLGDKNKDNFFEKKFKGDYFEYLACAVIKKNKDTIIYLLIIKIISLSKLLFLNNEEKF